MSLHSNTTSTATPDPVMDRIQSEHPALHRLRKLSLRLEDCVDDHFSRLENQHSSFPTPGPVRFYRNKVYRMPDGALPFTYCAADGFHIVNFDVTDIEVVGDELVEKDKYFTVLFRRLPDGYWLPQPLAPDRHSSETRVSYRQSPADKGTINIERMIGDSFGAHLAASKMVAFRSETLAESVRSVYFSSCRPWPWYLGRLQHESSMFSNTDQLFIDMMNTMLGDGATVAEALTGAHHVFPNDG